MSQRNSPLCRSFRRIEGMHVQIAGPHASGSAASAPTTPDPSSIRIGLPSAAPAITLHAAAAAASPFAAGGQQQQQQQQQQQLQLPRNTEWVAYRWMATIFAFLVCFSLASSSSSSSPPRAIPTIGSGSSQQQQQQGVLQHEPTELGRTTTTGCQCVVQITGGFNGVNGSRGERGPPGSFDPRVPLTGPMPLVLVGAGAGSSDATVEIEGTDMAGTVTVRTGSTLYKSANGQPVFTLTFGQSYPHRPAFVMLQPSSQSAHAIPVPVLQDRTAQGFTALGSSLSRSMVYEWIYLVHL